MGSLAADYPQLGWLECPSCFHLLLAWSVVSNGAVPPSNNNGWRCEEATLKHD